MHLKNTGILRNEYELRRYKESLEHIIGKPKKKNFFCSCFHYFWSWVNYLKYSWYVICSVNIKPSKYCFLMQKISRHHSCIWNMEYLGKKIKQIPAASKSHLQFIQKLSIKIRNEYALCNQKFISNIEEFPSKINQI